MPRTIEEGFRDFLTKLTPSATETAAVKKHRESVSACLVSNFGMYRFPKIGSFGNGTSIYGYSDVDYLACLPADQLSKNSTYSLQKVRDALATRFPTTGVRVNCPAVACPFGTAAAEHTEIVPAYASSDRNGHKIYGIADCASSWMAASPDAHNSYVRTVDDKLGRKVKPLIRFIKAWKYFRNVPISSFYLELRIAKYANGETSIIYDEDVTRVLKHLWDVQLANMQDPMGVSGYISACKTDALRKDALSKLGTALTRAQNARVTAKSGDIKAAFDWWQLVYDNQFPTYYR